MMTLAPSVSEAPKLIVDARVVNYDCNMFIIDATGGRNRQLIVSKYLVFGQWIPTLPLTSSLVTVAK
jgi:hypothetical protein